MSKSLALCYVVVCVRIFLMTDHFRITFSPKSIRAVKDKATARVFIEDEKKTFIVRNVRGGIDMHVGIGKLKEIGRRELILLARKIIQTAKVNQIRKIAITFDEFLFPNLKEITKEDIARILAENFLMANFEFVKFKTSVKNSRFVQSVVVCGVSSQEIKQGFSKGKIIGEEVNKCRTLSNTPGGDMTPRLLADSALDAVKGTGIKVTVLGRKEIAKEKMGLILGVAKGSEEEPQFIILEHKKGKKDDKPIVLVGKGVTFDTGGLNLKPSNSISEMYMDMSGGAAVIHAIVAAARLGVKKNIIGLIPAVENMPSGKSYRPGDILTSMSGKTIEVLNTDAEGRLILADALTYAERFNPRLVIDVATLTGGALAALGQRASAIMTRSGEIEVLLRQLGEDSGDYVWPLPLWKEYEDDIKGTFADLANIQTSGGQGNASAIIGGIFLLQFAKKYPWAHIDIASRMTAVSGEYLARGAAGAPVRLFVKLLEEY